MILRTNYTTHFTEGISLLLLLPGKRIFIFFFNVTNGLIPCNKSD